MLVKTLVKLSETFYYKLIKGLGGFHIGASVQKIIFKLTIYRNDSHENISSPLSTVGKRKPNRSNIS